MTSDDVPKLGLTHIQHSKWHECGCDFPVLGGTGWATLSTSMCSSTSVVVPVLWVSTDTLSELHTSIGIVIGLPHCLFTTLGSPESGISHSTLASWSWSWTSGWHKSCVIQSQHQSNLFKIRTINQCWENLVFHDHHDRVISSSWKTLQLQTICSTTRVDVNSISLEVQAPDCQPFLNYVDVIPVFKYPLHQLSS